MGLPQGKSPHKAEITWASPRRAAGRSALSTRRRTGQATAATNARRATSTAAAHNATEDTGTPKTVPGARADNKADRLRKRRRPPGVAPGAWRENKRPRFSIEKGANKNGALRAPE